MMHSNFRREPNLILVILCVFALSIGPSVNYTYKLLLDLCVLVVFFVYYRFVYFSKPFIIVFFAGLLIAMARLLLLGDSQTLFEVGRIVTIVASVCVLGNAPSKWIERIILYLVILNLLSIVYFILYPDTVLSPLIHARGVPEIYGRYSGLFVNVAVLGVFSLMCILIFLHKNITNPCKNDWLVISFGLVLMLFSGSKTAMMALVPVILGYYLFYLTVRGRIAFAVFAIICGVVIIQLDYFQEIKYLTLLLANGLSTGSSVLARFDIWGDFFAALSSSYTNIILGIPKDSAKMLSTTIDSDLLFIWLRFGMGGFFFATFLLSIYYFIMIVNDLKYALKYTLLLVAPVFLCCLTLGVFSSPQLIPLVVALHFHLKNSQELKSKIPNGQSTSLH